MSKIIIIGVNYNSYKELDCYLHSVSESAKHCGSLSEVVVAIADNTPIDLRQPFSVDYPHIKVLPYILDSNDGYLGSAEVVMSSLREDGVLSQYDFCIISNVDLTLSPNFVAELTTTSLPQDVGWVAPDIYTASTNKHENPFMKKRPSVANLYFWRMLYRFPILFFFYSSLARLLARKGVVCSSAATIYAGHGSIMIFTKRFISTYKEGCFPTFMYGEEIYFAELLLRERLKVLYIPNIVVNNTGGISTSLLGLSGKSKMNYNSLSALQNLFFK